MGAKQTAIAYIRQSVVKKKLESPAIQRAMIEAWAQAHDTIIVGEVRDLNRSGGTLTRPGLTEAKQALREGEADGIVVARSDRASRVALDGLGLIAELEAEGRWIAAADGSIDTTTRVGRMATTMNLAIAQNEYERYREQSAVVHRRAVLEKGRHMGPAPFGYLRDDANRLAADPDRARWVRHIFERRADRAGWLQISRELDGAGVRQRNGRKVSPLLCGRIVSHRVYLGEAKHGEHIRTGAHPAVVDETLWAAANRVAPGVRSDSSQARVHEDSLLRGLVRCAGCRYAMKRIPERGGLTRWRCRTLAGERTATHDCEAPAYLTGRQGVELDALAVERFMALAGGVGAETASADIDVPDLERRVQEAEAMLDELSSLEVRRELGTARWGKLVSEARASAVGAAQALASARAVMQRSSPHDAVELREAWTGMTITERQAALRSIVQAVFVEAGDGPLASRVHVVPVWSAVDIPRKGSRAFVVRPFGQD